MTFNRRKFLADSSLLFTHLAMMPLFLGCQQHYAPLRFATTTWIGSEFFHLANHLGLYQGKPFKLVTMPSSTSVMRAFAAETIELASLTLDETITLAAQQVPVNIIAVVDVSHGADVVLAKPHVQSATQLKGKRIAVEQSAVGAMMLYDLLAFAQLSSHDVEIAYFTVDQHVDAYQQQQIDVVITYEPFASKLRALGAHAIYSSAQNDEHIVDVLVATEQALANAKSSLALFLQGHWQAQRRYFAAPAQHLPWLKQRLGLEQAQIEQIFSGIQLPDLVENIDWFAGTPSKLLRKADKIQQLLLSAELIPQAVNLNQLISADIVKLLQS